MLGMLMQKKNSLEGDGHQEEAVVVFVFEKVGLRFHGVLLSFVIHKGVLLFFIYLLTNLPHALHSLHLFFFDL